MTRKSDDRRRRSRAAVRTTPGTPPSLQVGALCYRYTAKGTVRILLITSRDTGRWVIPKGWPMRRRTEAEAAAREAFEEAGVTGDIWPRSIGLYNYPKVLGKHRAIPCAVRVFPLRAREMLRHYPEHGQRRIKWFSLAKAARKVAEPDLARIIRGFDPQAAELAATGGNVMPDPPAEAKQSP